MARLRQVAVESYRSCWLSTVEMSTPAMLRCSRPAVTPSAGMKTQATRFRGRRSGAANPHVVACRGRGHGRRHGDHGIGVGGRPIEAAKIGTDCRTDGGDPLWGGMGGVERAEHQFDSQALVGPVEFGVAIVVADERPAADPVDVPDTEVVAGAVVVQVTYSPLGTARTEPLVVSFDQPPGIVNHVQAVMRSVRSGEPVSRAEHDPEAQMAGLIGHLCCGVSEAVPIEVIEAVEIGAGVTRQCPSQKCATRAPPRRPGASAGSDA